MSKYYDYLIENGATADEAKLLDTPTAARLFDKQQADLAAATAQVTTLDKNYKDYQSQVTNWHAENNTRLIKSQNDAIASAAEAARAKAALLKAQEQGLIDVAKDLGWTPDPPKVVPAALDERYVTMDQLKEVARREGRGIATMARIAAEHTKLFPEQFVNWDSLYDDYSSAGGNQTFEQFWSGRYKVGEAREAAATKQREAEIAKWKSEGAKEKETELVSKFGNPETRPLVTSRSPFTPRPADPLRKEHPWNQPDGKLSGDRVARVTKNLMEKQFTN